MSIIKTKEKKTINKNKLIFETEKSISTSKYVNIYEIIIMPTQKPIVPKYINI